MQYFDTIIYRGDDSVDTDTCKMHSQLHTDYKYFGGLMQYNTETGERGLKTWGKENGKNSTVAWQRHIHSQHVKPSW